MLQQQSMVQTNRGRKSTSLCTLYEIQAPEIGCRWMKLKLKNNRKENEKELYIVLGTSLLQKPQQMPKGGICLL